MTPKVSILVPIYKVPSKYLRKCIESTISQTLEEIEIILVDDGSPDQCGAICDEYAQKDNRIKVIHKKNEGLAAARNTAFDASKGDYITFLDGDDFLETKACECAYTTAKKQNVQMVFWNQYTDYPNRIVPVKVFGDEPVQFNKEGCRKLQASVLDFNARIAQVFSKLIKRDFLVKNNIRHVDELRQGAEGFVFNIQLFEHLDTAYYLPEYLLHYTYNEQSISHTPDENNYYMILKCFEFVKEYIQNSENRETLQRNLYNRILYVVITTAITGYFNPENKMSYKNKIAGFKKFLQEPLVDESLKKSDYEGLSKQRKFILSCIKHGQLWVLPILGRVRRIQLGGGGTEENIGWIYKPYERTTVYKNPECISVIVPVYNVEKYLRKCVDSVLMQTYSNLEILLVDDGSTDSSGIICDSYKNVDSRIRVFHKKNGGQGSARNLGLRNAIGKYYMFLDSDDSLKEDCVEYLYDSLIKNDVDVMCCNSDSFDENDRFVAKRTEGPECVILNGTETVNSLWYGEYINIAPWAKLFKREVWNEKQFEECYGEDYATMHKIYIPLDRIGYSNGCKLNYLIRGNSDIHSFSDKKLTLVRTAIENLKYSETIPELMSAAKAKAVSVCLHVLYQMPGEENYKEDRKEIKGIIKKYRLEVLKDKRTRKKTRYALLMSYFGLGLPKIILKIVHKRNPSI